MNGFVGTIVISFIVLIDLIIGAYQEMHEKTLILSFWYYKSVMINYNQSN